MQRGNDRAVLDFIDELHLVQQEHDARSLGRRGRPNLQKELGEVTCDRAFVGLAQVDSEFYALGSDQLDRAQVAERVAYHPCGACAELQSSERMLRVSGDLPDETAVRRELVVVAEEPLGLSPVLERVQQHRLAHAA